MPLPELTNAHTITHKRETTTAGAAGGPVRTLTTLGTKGCMIQPLRAEHKSRLNIGKEGMRISHVVYFSENPEADERDIFVYGTRELIVISSINELELGFLWKVYCSERTDVNRQYGN